MSQRHVRYYGERLVFIQKVPIEVCEKQAYIYLCIDEDMYLMQHKRTILVSIEEEKSAEETDSAVKKLGVFALLQSENLDEDELLLLYYTR